MRKQREALEAAHWHQMQHQMHLQREHERMMRDVERREEIRQKDVMEQQRRQWTADWDRRLNMDIIERRRMELHQEYMHQQQMRQGPSFSSSSSAAPAPTPSSSAAASTDVTGAASTPTKATPEEVSPAVAEVRESLSDELRRKKDAAMEEKAAIYRRQWEEKEHARRCAEEKREQARLYAEAKALAEAEAQEAQRLLVEQAQAREEAEVQDMLQTVKDYANTLPDKSADEEREDEESEGTQQPTGPIISEGLVRDMNSGHGGLGLMQGPAQLSTYHVNVCHAANGSTSDMVRRFKYVAEQLCARHDAAPLVVFFEVQSHKYVRQGALKAHTLLRLQDMPAVCLVPVKEGEIVEPHLYRGRVMQVVAQEQAGEGVEEEAVWTWVLQAARTQWTNKALINRSIDHAQGRAVSMPPGASGKKKRGHSDMCLWEIGEARRQEQALQQTKTQGRAVQNSVDSLRLKRSRDEREEEVCREMHRVSGVIKAQLDLHSHLQATPQPQVQNNMQPQQQQEQQGRAKRTCLARVREVAGGVVEVVGGMVGRGLAYMMDQAQGGEQEQEALEAAAARERVAREAEIERQMWEDL